MLPQATGVRIAIYIRIIFKSKIFFENGNTYYMHDPLGAGRGYSRSQVKAMRIVR